MTTAVTYAEFAAREAHGVSPAYERLSCAVSRNEEVLALLAALPPMKRQPNLFFGVVRFLGGPVEDPAAFHDYAVANWPANEAELRTRATQTNEAGRSQAFRSSSVRRPEWRRWPAYPRWCGGPAWI